MSSSGSIKLRYEKCLGIWGNATALASSDHSQQLLIADATQASVSHETVRQRQPLFCRCRIEWNAVTAAANTRFNLFKVV